MFFSEPSNFEIFIQEILLRPLLNRYAEKFAAKIPLTGYETVLDYGSGSGLISKAVLKKLKPDGRLICLDISGKWLNIAKKNLKKFPNVEFYQMNAEEFAEKKLSLDLVIVHYMLHDLPEEERKRNITAISGLMKEKAKLYIIEPTKESHGMPVEEIRELMDSAGLEMVRQSEKKEIFTGVYSKKPINIVK